ncbi:MAG: SUMF1/EgtB/PvdO family nonheme iron enzyme [Chromatiaceae bacterium]|nr:SUMF1/EgtB/PvdO family nonheme iron enzyme [Chromatiaceae bacterium]
MRLPQVYCDQRVTESGDAKVNEELVSHDPRLLLEAAGDPGMRRVVILGPVGSGKSSFINMLAWKVAQSNLGEVPRGLAAGLVRRPVVRIRLRSVARVESGSAGADILWDAARSEINSRLDETSVALFFPEYRESLRTCGIWLLDGLDEVPETLGARADLLDAIDALSGSLEELAQVIVTSRPYAYARPEQRLADWPLWYIQEMEEEQIATFLRSWYRIMATRKNWDVETAEENAQELIQILDEREYLGRMAGRPLLLTLIASLHLGSGALPHNRGNLYEDALRLLLQRWHMQLIKQKIPMDPAVKEVLSRDPETLEAALAELAWRTHERQSGEQAVGREPSGIDDVEAAGTFSRHLPEVRELLDFLDTHSGILVGDGAGMFRFAHRSFQEYLSAVYLSGLEDGDQLLLQRVAAQPDWWREVFLMYISHQSRAKSTVKGFLTELLPDAWHCLPSTARNDYAPVLAGLALMDLRLPEQLAQWHLLTEVLDRTRKGLRSLVAQQLLPSAQRLELGDLLATLGDPREGTVQRDNRSCPALVWIPIRVAGGSYRIGSDHSDTEAFKYEKPSIEIPLNDFQISRFPITNAQFECFIDDGGYKDLRWWPDSAREWWQGRRLDRPLYWGHRRFSRLNRPVVGICWYEARAFCFWLSARLERKIALPTEAQWERAARGPDCLLWPWGDEWHDDRCNSALAGMNEICAVGLFPDGAGVEGVMDMSGNVWEWTLSRWCDDYDGVSDDWNDPSGTDRRVLRGGAFFNHPRNVRAACRFYGDPADRDDNIGFRVSSELD